MHEIESSLRKEKAEIVSLKSHCLMWPPSFGAFKSGRDILIFRICQVFVSFYE